MNINSQTTRLNSYCKFMALLTFIPIICTVVACFSPLLFYFFNTSNIGLDSDGYSFFIATVIDINPATLSLWQAALATVIDTLLIIILVYAFYQLRLLFLSYSKSQYFTEKSSGYCFNLGKALVIWVILEFLSEPILTFILSFHNAPTERYLSISLTSDNIITLFPAMSIMIIGQILKKACEIAEENNQFI